MKEKTNGYFKLAALFVAILGTILSMVIGMFTFGNNAYAPKGEVGLLKDVVMEINLDVREMRGEIGKILLKL